MQQKNKRVPVQQRTRIHKTKGELQKMNLIALSVVFFVVAGSVHYFYGHSSPDRWCEMYKPALNLSLYDVPDKESISYCFNEGWSKYCVISFPENCPERVLEK